MDTALKRELQSREGQIMMLISSVGEDDPELAESLKQTLSIIKKSQRYQQTQVDWLAKTVNS